MAFRIADRVEETGRKARLDGADASAGSNRLKAVVLLAGAVRSNVLHKSTQRSSLQLPVGAGRTVFDGWREQLVTLAETLKVDLLPVRILVNKSSDLEPTTQRLGPLEITIERDPSSLRGTGGLLSDIARDYEDDDYLFVSNAGQILFEPLNRIRGTLAKAEADIALLADPQLVPTGMMRIRCGTLRSIPKVGFIDLNEQALPQLSKQFKVRVVRMRGDTSASVRTLHSYIGALRSYYKQMSGSKPSINPYAEDWRSTFKIIEPAASVHNSAVLHDSVVLAGAKVEAGAVLVRSVICPGVVVRSNTHVVDRCLAVSAPSRG